jgi:hypothetical protein
MLPPSSVRKQHKMKKRYGYKGSEEGDGGRYLLEYDAE